MQNLRLPLTVTRQLLSEPQTTKGHLELQHPTLCKGNGSRPNKCKLLCSRGTPGTGKQAQLLGSASPRDAEPARGKSAPCRHLAALPVRCVARYSDFPANPPVCSDGQRTSSKTRRRSPITARQLMACSLEKLDSRDKTGGTLIPGRSAIAMLKLLVPQPRLTKSPVRNVVGAKSELFRQDEEGKQADTRLQGSQEKGQTPKHLTAAFIIPVA